MTANDWKVYDQYLNSHDKTTQLGEGFFKNMKMKHLAKLRSRPNNIDKFMKTQGHKQMVHFKVCRTPVNKIVQKVLNMMTRGKIDEVKKKYNYDDMYHLYVIITFSDGKRYELQKNQIVEIKPYSGKTQTNSTCKESNVNGYVFNDIMKKLEKKYPNTLYLYEGWSSNCQDFLNKFTLESRINMTDFIMQYWKDPFEKKHMRKLGRFATDLSASFQRYILGKGYE